MFEQWQMDLFDECRVARLGTVAKDGSPHLVPVCYAMVREHFVIAVDEKPKRGGRLARLQNIEQDSRVSLLIDRYEDDWERLRWVRIDGHASVRGRGDSWPEAIQALRERYPQYREMAIDALPMIVITPGRVSAWRAGAATGR